MKVIKKRLDDLKHPEKNVRIHSEQQIRELKRSLEKFGQTRALVVDENNVILIGNGLYEAMVSLGYQEASVYVKTELSENDKKKLMIADNKTYALGIDNLDTLNEFLEELQGDLDIPGYDEEILQQMVADADEVTEKISEYSSVLSSMLIAKGATGLLGNAKNIATTLQPIGNAIKSIGLAAQTAPSVGAFISDLGAMVPTAAKFGLAAAAVTAAVVGIGVAVDNYNQKALNSNLEEHFGNIKLSAQEVQDIASGILDQKYLANVEVALNEVKNADKLREDAQKALESNDVLEFKSRVGIKLTTEEQEDYTSNIETFVKSKIEELESRTFAAHIHVQTYLGGTEEGQTLAQNIEKCIIQIFHGGSILLMVPSLLTAVSI